MVDEGRSGRNYAVLCTESCNRGPGDGKRGWLHGAYGANRREKLCMGSDMKKEMNM
jgi:hypothetical protein